MSDCPSARLLSTTSSASCPLLACSANVNPCTCSMRAMLHTGKEGRQQRVNIWQAASRVDGECIGGSVSH